MTNTSVERSDSQRSQRSQGNGPRVSFNRDVHVKRIDLNPDRFHSLPSRKKHSPVTGGAAKPVGRSASDASTKKSKKPSIFALFSGRGKPPATDSPATESVGAEIQWKRVGRSRSDVGTPGGAAPPRSNAPPFTGAGIRKRNNSENGDDAALPAGKKKSVPLSPIIESPSRQSYFGDADVPSGNIGYTHLADLDQVPSRPQIPPVSSDDAMHSSQQPTDRLPLTKGDRVDGLVKRLSAERFSPVSPNLQAASAFSYTRPNDTRCVYAQVMKDIEAQRPASPQQTRYAFQAGKAHSPLAVPTSPVSQSPPRKLYGDADEVDHQAMHGYRYGADDGATTRYGEERPIVPIIRQVNYQYPEINALSNRRQQLESRLMSRRVGGGAEPLEPVTRLHAVTVADASKDVNSNGLYENQPLRAPHDVVSAAPECPPRRRWRAQSVERDRAPYIEDCYEDDEADEAELNFVADRQHRAAPTVNRYRTGGGAPRPHQVIDLGYIEDAANLTDTDTDTMPAAHVFHQNKYREQYRQEFEPKSLDSQFGEIQHQTTVMRPQQRSVSPLPTASAGAPMVRSSSPGHDIGRGGEFRYPEQVHSLRREPRTQRSFDRGDSGIERDYRKSSSGAPDDFSTGSRTWKSTHTLYAADDADAKHRTEQFLRRERLHCERQQALRHSHRFRERSIDDGSHYDPRLDKYPAPAAWTATSTYRKYPSPTAIDHNANHTGSSTRSSSSGGQAAATSGRGEKKLSGLDKVKQLFTGKKKQTTPPSSSTMAAKKEKDKHVRREDEARHSQQSQHSSSYHQNYSKSTLPYNTSPPSASTPTAGNGLSILREPKLSDIATRRRLSTPKASPLPKRAPPNQTQPQPPTTTSTLSKSSRTTASSLSRMPHEAGRTTVAPAAARPVVAPKKAAWYKSLERLTSPMKNHHAPTKRLSQSTNTLNKDSRSIGLHDAQGRAQPSMQLPTHHQSHQQLHYEPNHGSMTGASQENLAPAAKMSSKHLRFFGDTDLDSNPPTLSKGHSMGTLGRKRTPLSTLTRGTEPGASQTLPRKYGAAAATKATQHLDSMPPAKPQRSGRKEFRSSTKHLHNISESASDADETDRAYKSSAINGNHATTTTTSSATHNTTAGELRTALKTRSRSSPVRRPTEHHHPHHQSFSNNGGGTSAPFQRRYGDSAEFNGRSSSELDQRRRSRSPSAGADPHRKPPTGSQQLHEARPHQRMTAAASLNAIDRRAAHSRERDRALDSSGTEGDSSQHSVVYLHATTVGAIPQPYVLNSRLGGGSARSSSLTGTATTLKSKKSKTKVKAPLQPMTRSVSRSLSVLAPWSPRHIHEGFEIDYAPQNKAEQQKIFQKTLPSKNRRAAAEQRHHSQQHSTSTPPPPPAGPTRTMGRKYYSQSSDPLLTSNGSTERRPAQSALLRHYREQDMRRETVSIPSRR